MSEQASRLIFGGIDLAPIIAAVITTGLIGLATGYLGSKVGLAVHGEKITSEARRLDDTIVRVVKLETQVDNLRNIEVSVARVETEVVALRRTTERVLVSLEQTQRDIRTKIPE
jgi:hypothetical protein